MADFQTLMTTGGWAAFSVLAAVFSAAMFLVNQYLKQPGHVLIFWSRVIVLAVMSPFILHLPWPKSPLFYMIVFLSVLFGTFADIRLVNVSARYGGGVVSRLQPLIVVISFFLWFLFDPGLLEKYLAHPLQTTGIVAALLAIVYFSSRLKKCEITTAAFLLMLPALLGYSLTTVLNKYAMHQGDMTGTVFGYMYVQSFFAVLMLGGYTAWREKRKPAVTLWRTRAMVLAATIFAASWICHMTFKNYAMVFTPNPSYQAALNLTAPLFISLYYAATGHREESDVKSGYGMVIAAVLLSIISSRP